MITKVRIEALNTAADGTKRDGEDGYGWITALRAPAIKELMAESGPLQISLFDQDDLAEITSPDYPGERLTACHNPALAADRAPPWPCRAAPPSRRGVGCHTSTSSAAGNRRSIAAVPSAL